MDPYWRTKDNKRPPSEPLCGFKNENCPEDTSGMVKLAETR